MLINPEGRQLVRIFVIALIFTAFALHEHSQAAVTLDAKVTDTELPHTNTPSSGTGVTVTSTVLDHKVTGLPPLAATASVSGATSYASAGVADTIVGGIATKTSTPSVIIKQGFPSGKTTAYSDPVGAVTLQVVPHSGDPNQLVPMQFGFPTSGSSDINQISDRVAASLLGGVSSPAQGIVRDNGGLSATQLAGNLDVVFTVNAFATQSGSSLFNFSGTATFASGGSGQSDIVTFGGGFNNGTIIVNSAGDSANPNAIATTLSNLPTIPFSVVAGQDFDLTVDVSMSIGTDSNGDPIGPDFTFGNSLTRPTGVLGLFTTGAGPVDRQNFSLVTTGSYIYNGAVDNNLATAENWIGGVVPPSGSTLIFDGVSNLSVNNNFASNTNVGGIVFSSTAGSFTISGQSISLSGDIIDSTQSFTQTINVNLALQKTPTVNVASAGSLVIAGTISGVFGLNVTGSGQVTLAGSNSFTGPVSIGNGATLSIAADNNLGAAPASPTPGDLMIADGGKLKTTTSLSLNANRGIALGPGTGSIETDAGSTLVYNGTLSNNGGAGGLAKTGAGTLRLNGANTYTGGTSVAGGILVLGATSAFPANTPLIMGDLAGDSGTLDLAGHSITVSGLSTVGDGTSNQIGSGTPQNVTLTLAAPNNSLNVFSGSIVDSLNGSTGHTTALTVNSGNLALTNNGNTYSGPTTLNRGATLMLASNNAISHTTMLLLNGGTLATGGNSQNMAATKLEVLANSTIDFGAMGNTLLLNNSSDLVWNAAASLRINNWSGNSASGGDQLIVGVGGLLPSQLGKIHFTGYLTGSQILSTGEVVPTSAPLMIGDANQDGQINVADISTLMTALSNPDAYLSNHPALGDSLAVTDVLDVNGDGQDTGADIQDLINVIANSGGGGSITTVPEPTSFGLLALGGLCCLAVHRKRM